MKVFGSRFLEEMTNNLVETSKWNWEPVNKDINKIYATGANTNTRSSTYASEKDDRSDSDKPQEGMLAV